MNVLTGRLFSPMRMDLPAARPLAPRSGLTGAVGGGPFDLLVSGVNHGANLGYDVFYSGTVGAALTAHLLGVPAIAVSLAAGPAGVQHWGSAAWAIGEAVRLWQESAGADAPFFNVNVPNLPQPDLDEMLITSPSRTSFLSNYRFASHSHEENGLAVTTAEPQHARREPWTDEWALALGCVSLTPFRAFPDLLSVAPVSGPRQHRIVATLCALRWLKRPAPTWPRCPTFVQSS